MRIMDTLYYYKKLLESRGYKVIYIGLYGSQNYNVSDERSDIDVKAIVLPTLADIVHRKATSKIIETKYGSIDCKDIITFNDVIKKGNFSYIEAIQSGYSFGDIDIINKLFGDIQVNLKSIIGGMQEKRKALTHEYPSKVAEFEQFGCDPKQFHHIWRLCELLNYILDSGENVAFLRYDNENRELMIKLKRQMVFSLDMTKGLADQFIENAKNRLNETFPQGYKYEPINNTEALDNYIEEEIRKQLIKKD
jgi:hypothetical protein